VAATTINKVCGSGLKSVVFGAQAVKLGDMDIVVAGGMESMSNAPYLLPKAREGYRMGTGELVDSMILDGLWCAFADFHMGNTGEIVAEKYKITREEQDEYAYNSHRKAIEAQKNGWFKNELVPVEVKQRKNTFTFEADEGPREDTTVERLAKLRPAFKKDGTVTAGNAPGVNDGAAAVVVTSAEKAEALGVKPLATIKAYATSGIEPELVMMAPVEAVNSCLGKAGWDRDEVDLYELNEAFSVQALAVSRELKLNPDKVNVHGGAVALGHPIGASGARVLTTLLYAMEKNDAKKGIAALCLGGGNAVAMAVER
jgi:acetyl-CoA C-acetyltransferase